MVKFSYGTITSATIVKTALNFLPAKVFIRSCTKIEINTSFRSSIDISQKQAGCDNSIIEALCLIFAPGIVQETLAMIVARLEHFQSGLVLQIRHFDLLLQFDVLLLSLVEFHDFDALLLHQTTLLDVEFLFRLKESWEGGKKGDQTANSSRKEKNFSNILLRHRSTTAPDDTYLSVNFLDFFLSLLIDESHHMLDLLFDVIVAQRHLGILLKLTSVGII